MVQQTVAAVVAQMLATRGWTMGTIECGTDGVVGHRLFDTEEGPTVLGDSLTVNTVEEAIDFLELPWKQFERPGDFSTKAARAAAREGRAFLGVDVCLAVWAQPLPADAASVQETIHLAVHTGEQAVERTMRYGGPKEEIGNWLAEEALELVRRALS